LRPEPPSTEESETETSAVYQPPAQDPPSHRIEVVGALASGVTVKLVAPAVRPAPFCAGTSFGSAGTVGEPAWLEVAGQKVAFVAWNNVPGPTHADADTPGVAWLTKSNIDKAVKKAKDGRAEVIVRDPQWGAGSEDREKPLPNPQKGPGGRLTVTAGRQRAAEEAFRA